MGDERNSSIDFLRALAIGLIVMFHAVYAFAKPPNEELRSLGFIGVSLFFIISGFLLAKNYPEKSPSLAKASRFWQSIKFYVKWFLNRYVKIASLYYLALIATVILFFWWKCSTEACKSGLLKDLLLHFTFLHFEPGHIYGIINSALFLIPLMAFYIAFPALYWLIKKYDFSISLMFAATLIARVVLGGLVSFNPVYFLGEFCFGIMVAKDKKNIFLFSSLLMVSYSALAFVPFVLFYAISSVAFSSPRIFTWVGKNTLPIFLFHESFIYLLTGSYKVYTLSKAGALVLTAVVTLLLIYISSKINKFICGRYLNTKQEAESK